MLESDIENLLRNETKKLGGKCYKFSSPGNNGVPDRIVLLNGSCYFVELKKPGENLRPLQQYVKKEFRKQGFEVYVLDTVEKVEAFIKNLTVEGGDPFHV